MSFSKINKIGCGYVTLKIITPNARRLLWKINPFHKPLLKLLMYPLVLFSGKVPLFILKMIPQYGSGYWNNNVGITGKNIIRFVVFEAQSTK